MARIMLNFLAVVFLFLNSLSFNVVGRSIIVAYEIKNSGPSPGGKGHGFPTVTSLGNVKNSGLSFRGKGRHESRNAESLVLMNMKSSGPSARGKGHEFPTTEPLRNLKKTIPSPRTKGHENHNDKSFGMKKNSGPTDGGKEHGFKDNEMVQETHDNSSPSLNGPKQMFSNSFGAHGIVKSSGPGHTTEGQGVNRYENRYETKGSGPSSGGIGH